MLSRAGSKSRSSKNTHPHRLERHRSSLGFLSSRCIPALHVAPNPASRRMSDERSSESEEKWWTNPLQPAGTVIKQQLSRISAGDSSFSFRKGSVKQEQQSVIKRAATIDPKDIDPKGWDRLVIPQDNHWKSAFDILVAVMVLFTAVSVPIELAYRVRTALPASDVLSFAPLFSRSQQASHACAASRGCLPPPAHPSASAAE